MPELLAFLRLLEVTLGQPRCPGNHFALGLAVVGDRFALRIHDFQFHHGHGNTGLDALGGLLLQGQFQILCCQVSGAEKRAGFRHAVPRVHGYAQLRPGVT
nr:hypothetical protein [Marinobacter sp. DS40M8]